MNYEEALEWLRGDRSMTNIIPQDPFETWQVRTASADAAMCEQAYWIARSHREVIVKDEFELLKAKFAALREWHKRIGCMSRLDPKQHFTNEGDCHEPVSATMDNGESLVMFMPGEHASDIECDICSILHCHFNSEDHYHHDGCAMCDSWSAENNYEAIKHYGGKQ